MLSSPGEPSEVPINFLNAQVVSSGCPQARLGISLRSWEGQRGFMTNPLPLPPTVHPQLSATFTIPIWQWFLTRFGKKTAVYIGISVSGAKGVGPGLSWGLLVGVSGLTHLPVPTPSTSQQCHFSSWWPSWRVT